MKALWEIFVPTVSREGKPYRTRYHRVWDSKVRAISGGLTVLKPVIGQWMFENELYSERMIPVRVACTRGQILDIMEMTKQYYDQIDVMAYKVSEDVLFLSELRKQTT